MPAPRASEAAIAHALRAWQAVMGKLPGAVEITRDGTIRLIAAVDRPAPEEQPRPKKWSGGK